MGGLFNYDGPLMRGMNRIADLLILNIVYLLCCIPIITIGPATSALYYVTLKMVREEQDGVVKEFWKSFRLNFRQAIGLHLLYFVAAFIFVADAWFALHSVQSHGAMNDILLVCACFLSLVLVVSATYAYPLLAKFENTTKRLLKLSLLLAIRHLPTTIALLAITAVPIWLISIMGEEVISFLFLYSLLGFSTVALLHSRFLRKVFDRYIPDPEEDAVSSQEDVS